MFGFFESKATELWSVMAPEKTDGEKLFICVEEGRVAEVENYLVNGSMDPNLKNKAGNTLLHVAAYHGREAVVKLLLQHGADVNASGARMNSCLHFTAASGHLDLAKFFVEECELKASQKNSLGQSAYDTATGYGVKQYLMKLVLAEEARDGTAPAMLGISRDVAKDQQRLQNLPPPPTANGTNGHALPPPTTPTTSANAPPFHPQSQHSPHTPTQPATTPTEPPVSITPPTGLADPNYRSAGRVSRPIKEDGFTTTVGNPELAAKYGNHTTYRPSPTPQASLAPATQGPPKLSSQRTPSPFAARGRYVAYDAKNNVATKPMQKKPAVAPQVQPSQFQGKIKMFTPQQPASPTATTVNGNSNGNGAHPVYSQSPGHQSSMKGLGAPKLGSGPIRPPHMAVRPAASNETYTQGTFE